jgi:hypothetical protein
MRGDVTQAMPKHRRGAATKQMARRRPNPLGASTLRAISALLVAPDATASNRSSRLDLARKPLARR